MNDSKINLCWNLNQLFAINKSTKNKIQIKNMKNLIFSKPNINYLQKKKKQYITLMLEFLK